jgi:putative membrane protein insertion efficiency factor
MPPLRKFLRQPVIWLILLLAISALALLDSGRDPQDQLTARGFVASIRLYQRVCAPLVSRWIFCRYRPTCSEYCIQAAQRHGIRKGLLLCTKRVLSCTKNVAPGTLDPVPQPGQKGRPQP